MEGLFLEKLSPLLDELKDGSLVALLTMTGSCCPVTRAHCMAFECSRQMLLGEIEREHHGRSKRPRVNYEAKKNEHFEEVLGLLSLNNEQKVCKKMRGKGMPSISYEDRAHLVQLATADVPWMSFNPMREQDAAKSIQLKWPNLRFIRYELNGADDVCRFAKWRWCSPSRRFITMGRPHFTAEVIKGATRAQVQVNGEYFILGREPWEC